MDTEVAVPESLRKVFSVANVYKRACFILQIMAEASLVVEYSDEMDNPLEVTNSEEDGEKMKDAFFKDHFDLITELDNLGDRGEHYRHQLLLNELRELTDVNGRLFKLLNEKDFEINHMKKKWEDERILLLAGATGMLGDAAAVKIVELSKKNRELTIEVEQERAKSRQNSNRIKTLENDLQTAQRSLPGKTVEPSTLQKQSSPKEENPLVKSLKDKLSANQLKATEYRNQVQILKQELKVAHKVIISEVGGDVNFQQLLGCAGNVRGRAQQILALQSRIRDLEQQLGTPLKMVSNVYEECSINSRKNLGRNVGYTRSTEKEKKEEFQLMESSEALQRERDEVKKVLEACKSRNKCLSSDMKALKSQMSSLLVKSKHDDELVDAMLKEKSHLLEMLSQLTSQNVKPNSGPSLSSKLSEQKMLIENLYQVVADKENTIRDLEDIIQQFFNGPSQTNNVE
ncbi:coiled-coil domain-containing protein 13-like isoform X2 [Stigmatopora argus]